MAVIKKQAAVKTKKAALRTQKVGVKMVKVARVKRLVTQVGTFDAIMKGVEEAEKSGLGDYVRKNFKG